MMNSDEEFQKELHKAFAIEAEEHLHAIADALISMEKQKDAAQGQKLLETVFRAAHSLKGAARAVNMPGVGAVCQSLESIFSAIKKGDLDLVKQDYDVLQRAGDMMSSMLASSRGDDESMIKDIVDELEKIVHENRDLSEKPISRPSDSPDKGRSMTQKSGQTPLKDGIHSRQMMPENIRIAASKLDAILLQSEELISIKLAKEQQIAELRETLDRFKPWKLGWQKMNREMQKVRPYLNTEQSTSKSKLLSSGIEALEKSLDWSYSQILEIESCLNDLLKNLRMDQHKVRAQVDHLLGTAKNAFMLPFVTLLQAFPRMVRDISRDQNKEAELKIIGADIEIDKRILERIKDPLVHLVRNCIDHGLERPKDRKEQGKPESGLITIEVSQLEGGKVQVLVMDDGRGIDPDKVRQSAVKNGAVSRKEADSLDEDSTRMLIFHSGVSTSSIITDISGRGLGMAIVKEAVDSLGGDIFIESGKDQGTTYRILLPLTIATFRGVLVSESDRFFVVPTSCVERVLKSRIEDVRRVENRETVAVNGIPLALARLGSLLELDSASGRDDQGNVFAVLVLKAGNERMAFAVDKVVNEQEVLFKGLGRQLERVRNIAGVTILATGEVVPVLNVMDLMRSAVQAGSSARVGVGEALKEKKKKAVLVAEDTITSRMLLKNILTSGGFDVKAVVDGVEAWKALREKSFDLVVSDVEMPGMNGFELTEKIRGESKFADLPVVLVTGLESKDDRERGIEVGADAYIIKSSFDQSNLLEVVKRLCG
jgi:two-component system, chemotaxis family, sensor kinase CheA